MDELFKNLPEIIKQSATSPLGVVVLIIIVLAIIAFFFFKGANEKTRIIIFVMLFICFVGFGVLTIYKARVLSNDKVDLEHSIKFEVKLTKESLDFIKNLSSRLEKVMTNLNRRRQGQPNIPEGFMIGREIVPLTEIYEDLNQNRYLLTDELYSLLRKKADLAIDAANVSSEQEWNKIEKAWIQLSEQIQKTMQKATM